MPTTPNESGRNRKLPPNDLDLTKMKSIDSSSSSGESANLESSQDCSEFGRTSDSTKADKVDEARRPSDESKFAFYATVDERERCEEHLKSVTEAYERWLEALKPVKDEAGLVCLNLCSMMKAFHTAISNAIKAEGFFSNFQQEAQKLDEEIKIFIKGDKSDNTSIKKVIDNMYRHFSNQCTSGNPCAVAEGGDKELLRYGDLAMKKLFEQTKQMSVYMSEVVHMVEKKISLEIEYNRQLHKMSSDHRNVLQNMQNELLPFIDILESLMMDENDYANNMSVAYEKLMQERFVKPLKARIRDLDDASLELQREWSKKKAAYEKAKENTKEANNRHHKACLEVERELAKGPASERSRLQEREQSKRKYAEEFAECRKLQTSAFEELCKKREWIVAATLNVVSQAEKKLQSAVGHLLSSLTSGLQQRPVYHRSLFIESLTKPLNYNETIVYDILYRDAEIARTPKDLEAEFEQKENPFEKETLPQPTARPTMAYASKETPSKQPDYQSTGIIGWFSSFKSSHTFEKLAADDTRYLTKCVECHIYVYEGQVCTRCHSLVHLEHLTPPNSLKYPTCDLAKENPAPVLKYFRRSLEEQPKAPNGDPLFLHHCLPLVENVFIKEHGLYRQEGVRKKASQLCNDIEENISKVNPETTTDHKVISLVIKHYIRAIPKSLLEEKFFHNWMTLGADIVKSEERGERIPTHVVPGIKYNLKQINPLNRRAAMMLFEHLRKVASFSHFNNMNSTNLGIVFGPNLIRKSQLDLGLDVSTTISPKDNKEHTDYLKSVTSFMIDNFDEVFNDDVMNTSGGPKRDSCTSAGTPFSGSRTSQVSNAESEDTYVTVDPLHAATLVPSDTFSSISSAGGLSPTTPVTSSNDRFYSDEPSTLGSGRPRLCDLAALETVQSDPNVNNSEQSRKGLNGVTRSANDLR